MVVIAVVMDAMRNGVSAATGGPPACPAPNGARQVSSSAVAAIATPPMTAPVASAPSRTASGDCIGVLTGSA
jgi:hypothetical protein